MADELEPWEGGPLWITTPPTKPQRLGLLDLVGDRGGYFPQKPKIARDRIYQGLVSRGLFDPVKASVTERGRELAAGFPEATGKKK